MDEIRASELQIGDTYEDGGEEILVAAVDEHADHVLISGTYVDGGMAVADALDRDTVVTLIERDPQPEAEPTVDLSLSKGSARLHLQASNDRIVLDSFDQDGNCRGTIADTLDGWAERIEADPAQKSLWDNDLIQFARLLDEIQATFSEIDYPALEASMDLEMDDIDALFERAQRVWDAAKAAL